jgi:hypothetical protein
VDTLRGAEPQPLSFEKVAMGAAQEAFHAFPASFGEFNIRSYEEVSGKVIDSIPDHDFFWPRSRTIRIARTITNRTAATTRAVVTVSIISLLIKNLF